ncbi:MAG: hypothetical protein NWT12_14785 [Paracoccaceae bacterium]|nr:hypothetical protein [Paracoccaceae bacterium]
MAEGFETMRSWCIGRYTVDVPARFTLRAHTGSLPAVELVDLGKASATDTLALIAERRDALAAGRDTDEEGAQLILMDERQSEAGPVLAAQRRFPELDYTSDIWREEVAILRYGHLMRITALMSEEGASAARAEMDLVAATVRPWAGDAAPPPGVCLPGFVLELPRISGAWSMIFMPDGIEGPVGLKLTLVERAPDLPPLDPPGRFDDPGARAVQIAGLTGQELRRVGAVISLGAVAAATPSADGWGTEIIAEYFDERPDAGSAPLTPDAATDIWEAVLQSIRPRG